MTILMWVAAYLLTGLIVLFLFDLATGGRIRTRFPEASDEAQTRLASSGNFMGHRGTVGLLVVITWLFWPLVLVGAATDKSENEKKEAGDGQ